MGQLGKEESGTEFLSFYFYFFQAVKFAVAEKDTLTTANHFHSWN